MDESNRRRWLRTMMLFGVVYFVIGIAFAKFAAWSATDQMRFTWRLLAFLASGVAFAIHIVYEHFRLGSSARLTAWHVSLAVAVGAFALAVSANIHALWVGSGNRRLLIVALVAWPALTAIPAFLVAFVASAALRLIRRST